MATQQPLLDKPRKSLSNTLGLILTLIAVISSSALIASYLIIRPTSFFNLSSPHHHHHVCDHVLDKESCFAQVSQGTTTNDQISLLQCLLMKSIPHIKKAKHTASAIKLHLNCSRQKVALGDCEEVMDDSKERVFKSIVALNKRTPNSLNDAQTWLSAVLTNHFTCLDELEGTVLCLMEPQLNDLISRARASLAMLVEILKQKSDDDQFIEEPLNGDFPSWVTRKDRRLLEAKGADIKANVVVAKDGSGTFKTVAEAVASAPDNDKTRYVIYVKKGTYKENVEIGRKKNVMLVGDGMDATIITGNLNAVDGNTTFKSATVAAGGDGFIGQDIWFQNTAGPEKHQAVALLVCADTSVINRCRIDGFHNTLYVHSNRQFYRDSFIIGTVDFIFGNAAVVFQNCNIVARKPMNNEKNMVTAQGREDPCQNTGISIQQCQLTASSDLKPVMGSIKTYLGRPLKKYSRTVVMQSTLDSHIDPAGWAEWDDQHKDFLKTLYFGEYMNIGPGAGTDKRVNWSGYHVIRSASEASKFTVAQLIQGDVWLKNTGVNFIAGL